ncbi:hypothetical protein PMI13_00515 [Chryseobacterium populi]|uniref:Uncharacterized protein n=2 Tax=Chryseobacterium populi TaxID=1144316 RepID=J2KQN2_9FLAO|nr:hypothetical protein PMI13_00515 [Chryseobacterium populi]
MKIDCTGEVLFLPKLKPLREFPVTFFFLLTPKQNKMPQNTTSGSLPTTPDGNGLNVRPDLMPESFFFLEKGKSFTQSSSDKFGITGPYGSTVFRTTSKINGYNGKVFTLCQGQVLLQPCGTDASKINVILKPFNQPIKGLAIKYIIYRGMNRADFFDSTGTINGIGATGFVDVIRKEFTSLYTMLGIAEPTFTAQYLGYPVSGSTENPDEVLIDDYFFKVSQAVNNNGTVTEPANKAYELPMIPRGTHLGTINGQLGIDIVLNEGDYTIENDPNPFKLNLTYARKTDHILDPAAGTTAFKSKLIRESATQFIDIAAFYGLHTQGKGKLFVKDQAAPAQTNDEVYDLIKNFATAKTTYLYIQSSRQRSYNFYGNYKLSATNTNNMKIGTTVNDLSEQKFDDGWPLKEFSERPSLVIQLTTDNNDAAALYVKQGVLSSTTANEDYFIRGGNLLQEAGDNINTDFTKPISFDLKKTSSNFTIGSFVQLIYEGKSLEITTAIPPIDPSEKIYLKDIDDVFGLINASPKIEPKSPNELRYVIDQNLLLIDFDNNAGGKDIATVTTKRVEDQVMKNETDTLRRVTYETLLNNIRQNTGSFFESRSAYLDNSNSGTVTYSDERNNFYTPENPYYFSTEVFTDIMGETVTSLFLKLEHGTLPSKKILGITEDENLKLITIINQSNLNNPKFYFMNEMPDDADAYTSSEQKKYKRYSLSIIGENSSGDLVIALLSEKIYVNTVDDMIFSSEEYAKWSPKTLSTQKLTPSFFI